MSEGFSDEEVNILSTSTIALLDSKLCVRTKDGRFRVRCGDGKKRVVTEDFLLGLQDKIMRFAGHDSIQGDISEVKQIVKGGR